MLACNRTSDATLRHKKFARSLKLLEIRPQSSLIKLEELALPFALNICEHLQINDKQVTSASSQFLDCCRKFNRNEIDQSGSRRLPSASPSSSAIACQCRPCRVTAGRDRMMRRGLKSELTSFKGIEMDGTVIARELSARRATGLSSARTRGTPSLRTRRSPLSSTISGNLAPSFRCMCHSTVPVIENEKGGSEEPPPLNPHRCRTLYGAGTSRRYSPLVGEMIPALFVHWRVPGSGDTGAVPSCSRAVLCNRRRGWQLSWPRPQPTFLGAC